MMERRCGGQRLSDAGNFMARLSMPNMGTAITAPSNPLVRSLAALATAAGRREAGAFVVEGHRAIAAFLQHGWQPQGLYLREDLEIPAHWPTTVQRLGERALARCSSQSTPSGYLARFALPGVVAANPRRAALVCWGLRDPGNVGTLLRSAAAFGWPQVLLVDCCDPWSPKVVQASAGALATVPLCVLEPEPALSLLAQAYGLALVVEGGNHPAQLPRHPWWVCLGSEADGLPHQVRQLAQAPCTLPMCPSTESLNAAVAGSIALYVLQESAQHGNT